MKNRAFPKAYLPTITFGSLLSSLSLNGPYMYVKYQRCDNATWLMRANLKLVVLFYNRS
jgi:hypothetical protein